MYSKNNLTATKLFFKFPFYKISKLFTFAT